MKAVSIEPSVLVRGTVSSKQATNTAHLSNIVIQTHVIEKIPDTLADLGFLSLVNCVMSWELASESAIGLLSCRALGNRPNNLPGQLSEANEF